MSANEDRQTTTAEAIHAMEASVAMRMYEAYGITAPADLNVVLSLLYGKAYGKGTTPQSLKKSIADRFSRLY